MEGLPEDFVAVVRTNQSRTVGWVVASREPCLTVREDEALLIDRAFKPLRPKHLHQVKFPSSWYVGVLLCPGDDVAEVATWFAGLPDADRARVRFYCHPDCDLATAFAAWVKLGLPPPVTVELPSMTFAAFHKRFGRDHAWRVYLDAKAPDSPATS